MQGKRPIRNRIWYCILIVIVLITGVSCNEPQSSDISTIPGIELVSVKYEDVPDIQTPDTIFLTINYTDGDSDLGLDVTDTLPPYNAINFFPNNRGGLLEIGDSDTLPPYTFPYSCSNYALQSRFDVPTQKFVFDTLYIEPNTNSYNMLVDFYVADNAGNFSFFDWTTAFPPNCQENFYARFTPVPLGPSDKIIGNFRIKSESRFKGQITYKMYSRAFQFLFADKSIKLRVQVLDRKLNASNIINTQAFSIP